MQFASLISSLINIISLDVTSFNSAVTLKLKCGKVVCVEFFIFGDGVAPRSHTGRPRTCLVIVVVVIILNTSKEDDWSSFPWIIWYHSCLELEYMCSHSKDQGTRNIQHDSGGTENVCRYLDHADCEQGCHWPSTRGHSHFGSSIRYKGNLLMEMLWCLFLVGDMRDLAALLTAPFLPWITQETVVSGVCIWGRVIPRTFFCIVTPARKADIMEMGRKGYLRLLFLPQV